MKTAVFRIVTPCNLAAGYISFGETCCPHLHSRTHWQPCTKPQDATHRYTNQHWLPLPYQTHVSAQNNLAVKASQQTVYYKIHKSSAVSPDIFKIFFSTYLWFCLPTKTSRLSPNLQYQLTTLNNSTIKKNKPIKHDKHTALNSRDVCCTRSVQIIVQWYSLL